MSLDAKLFGFPPPGPLAKFTCPLAAFLFQVSALRVAKRRKGPRGPSAMVRFRMVYVVSAHPPTGLVGVDSGVQVVLDLLALERAGFGRGVCHPSHLSVARLPA